MRYNLLFTYGSTAILMIANVLIMLVINKYASVDVFGKLTIMLATVGMLINFITFRTGEAVTRFIIENKGDPLKQSSIVAFGLLFDFFVGLVVLVLVTIFEPIISSIFFNNEDLSSPIIYIMLTLLFNLLGSSVIGRYTGDKNFKVISLFRVVDPIIKISIIGYLVLAGELTLVNISLSYMWSSIIKLLIMWLVYFKDGYRLSYKGIDSFYMKAYVTYTAKTFISTTLKSFNENADVMLIGAFLSPYVVGVYQSLKVITQPVRFIINPLSSVKFPYYISMIIENEIKKVTLEIVKLSSLFLTFSIVVFMLIYYFQDLVFLLVNVKVNDISNYILFYHLILTFGLCLADWWFRLISLSTDPKYSIYSNGFSAVLIWTLGVFSIKYYGIEGFLVGMSIVLISRASYHYYILLTLNRVRSEIETK